MYIVNILLIDSRVEIGVISDYRIPFNVIKHCKMSHLTAPIVLIVPTVFVF